MVVCSGVRPDFLPPNLGEGFTNRRLGDRIGFAQPRDIDQGRLRVALHHEPDGVGVAVQLNLSRNDRFIAPPCATLTVDSVDPRRDRAVTAR